MFLFRNLSNLPTDSTIYDYFSSYVAFEFGDEETENKNENVEEDDSNKIKFI
ncbi:hypothetical protein IKI14_02595 [bacterium]|nr:hypothetical protein [bacterium]